MANKKASKKRTRNQHTAVVDEPTTATAAQPSQEQTMTEVTQTTDGANQFSLVRINKYGNPLYRRANSRGTIAFSKSMFAGDPPQTLTITGAQFSEPGDTARQPSPEKLEKLEKAAVKARERAAKAQAKLDKINARLGKQQSLPQTEVAAQI